LRLGAVALRVRPRAGAAGRGGGPDGRRQVRPLPRDRRRPGLRAQLPHRGGDPGRLAGGVPGADRRAGPAPAGGLMLRPPRRARWRRLALVPLALLAVSYLWYARKGFAHGGSAAGVAYGALGLAAIAVLLFFGVRKRWYRSTWGRLESWLQSHVYL